MIVLRLMLAFALLAVPAIAQDATSSSSADASSSVAPSDTGSSVGSSDPADTASSQQAAPGGLSDAELEMAVRAAYSAAANFASGNGNYFARDGLTAPLHDAIATAVAAAYPTMVVPADAFADLDAAKVCLAAAGAALRIAANTYGDGIALAAVTETRVFAYDYDPHKAADIKVLPAADCIKPK